MGLKDFEKSGIAEVMEGKLYFAVLQRQDDLKVSWLPRPAICFSVDNELPGHSGRMMMDHAIQWDYEVYEPFYADFGPLNLACTYHFCWKLHELLKEGEAHGRCVCFCCSSDPKKKPNAAVLAKLSAKEKKVVSLEVEQSCYLYPSLQWAICLRFCMLGAYLVLFEDWDPEVAYGPLAQFESFLPFRDPTCGISTYHLSVLDCLRALAKGKKIGWIDFNNFNVEEYEYFEKVENGDLNWIVPNKLVAFSGPGARRIEMCGYRTLVPEDYVDYFKQTGVTTVIRLNKRMYDKRNFTDHGLTFYDLYFPDGSCPPERIVQQFLEIVEGSSGSVAVHCKAGLGRTGVLIGCYIMKHYRFTANEHDSPFPLTEVVMLKVACITFTETCFSMMDFCLNALVGHCAYLKQVLGYLRVVRPGSVIGPQQHFLRDMQSRMWKAGELMRRRKSDTNRNIKQYIPPAAHDSLVASNDLALVSAMSALSTGASTCGQGKGNLPGTRKQKLPFLHRGTQKHTICLSFENGTSTHRFRIGMRMLVKAKCGTSKSTGANSSTPTMKERRGLANEEELINNFRAPGVNISPVSTRARKTTPTRSLNAPSSPVSVAAATTDPCSTSTCKNPPPFKENPCPYNLQSRPSLCPNNNDNPGILRNASVDSKAPSGDVCTQRIINAAGQPRKVIVPVSQASQNGIRNSSPGRRRSNSTSRN
eukprot:Gb_00815 [translate_table: standard]